MNAKINGMDLNRGTKRVNLTLSIPDFERLFTVAEYNHIPVTTQAESWVVRMSREEEQRIRKQGYIPRAEQGELFHKKKDKKK